MSRLASRIWAAWRSLTPREALSGLLLALLYGLIDLPELVHVSDVPGWQLAVARELLKPQLVLLGLLLTWLPVLRSQLEGGRRIGLLVAATVAGALLGQGLAQGVIHGLAWPDYEALLWQRKGMTRPPLGWQQWLSGALYALIPCGLLVALTEMQRRQTQAQAQLDQLLLRHSAMARQALASRLAALQAQVEPELLFDTLVDVEQAYQDSSAEAPARLERLIRHLRVALPRLRESGSRLEIETELLDSYLAVMSDRHRSPVQFSADCPEALRQRTLPPMLLLPLLQRALRLAWQRQHSLPTQAELAARGFGAGEQGLSLTLKLSLPGLCGDDASLQELAARLRDCSAGLARLRCHSTAGHTHFTLELPP